MRGLVVLLMLLVAFPARAEDANELFAQDRFAAAADAFAQAGESSPLHAAALIRLGRLDEARSLSGGDVGHAARAFALAGEVGRARTLLAAGLADRPDDAVLLRQLGELELAVGRPLKALAPLARAVELDPADPALRAAEVRALTAAGLPVRAAQAAERARRAGMVDIGLLAAEMAARQSYGDHRGVVALVQDNEAAVADAAGLSALVAASLDALGAHVRAAERRKTAPSSVSSPARAVPLGELAQARSQQAQAAGDWPAAALAALDWARLRPDDPAAAALLLSPDIARHIGWMAGFRHLATLAARDPEDAGRHALACELHAEAPGSEILALAHAHAVDRLAAAGEPAAERARACRASAMERLGRAGRILDLDLAAMRVVLERSPGETVAVQVHAETGRLLRVAHDARWLEATWRDDRLVELRESSGDRLRLEWRGGTLAELARDGRRAFRAQLGSDGGLVRLSPAGATSAYNDAVALVAAWPLADAGAALWLRLE